MQQTIFLSSSLRYMFVIYIYPFPITCLQLRMCLRITAGSRFTAWIPSLSRTGTNV